MINKAADIVPKTLAAEAAPGSIDAGKSVYLSKTDYLIWRECAHDAWMRVNEPEVWKAADRPSDFDRALMATGNAVDVLARDLFPGGVMVGRRGAARSARLIKARTPVLYQPAFKTDRYVTASDILKWNGTAYDLYEVKASTDSSNREDEYAHDIAFQVNVLLENGVPLGKFVLVRLSSQYVFDGSLNIDELFTFEDFTGRVRAMLGDVAVEMAAASTWIRAPKPAGPCGCIYKGRSAQCATFAITNPDVPAYGVHDLTRIGLSVAKLATLVDAGVLNIQDISDDFDLSERQWNQVIATKTGKPFFDRIAIARFLDALKYPIAFLDYETYGYGIPRFHGYSPYNHAPFQFSAHVVDRQGAEATHCEFLYTGRGCPDAAFAAALRSALPATGSVLVWNKTFECGVNEKLGNRSPFERPFLKDINDRTVDLMAVFSKQMYVHPKFKGKTALKFVLPAVVPSLSYKGLTIQDGGMASETWHKIVWGAFDTATANRQRENLLEYCKLELTRSTRDMAVPAGRCRRWASIPSHRLHAPIQAKRAGRRLLADN